MDKIIVFVTAGRWQMAAIEKAKNMGYKIAAIDSNPNALGLSKSDYKLVSNLDNIEKIFKFLNDLPGPISASVSYCSEAGLSLSSKIKEYYSLGFPNQEELKFIVNKKYQRILLDNFDFPNPFWYTLNSPSAIKNLGIPPSVIIKPVDSSGSRGVSIISSTDELPIATSEALKFSSSGEVIVEEYIEGTEYTIEAISYNFNLHIVMITKKSKSALSGRTVSDYLRTVDPSSEEFKTISNAATSILSAFNIKRSLIHLEVIYGRLDNKVYLIDLSLRGGGFGLSTYLIPMCTGLDYEKISILIETNSFKNEIFMEYSPAVLLFEPTKRGTLNKVSGIEQVNRLDGVYCEQLLLDGSKMNASTNDNDRIYLACVKAASDEVLDKKIEQVRKLIQVDIL